MLRSTLILVTSFIALNALAGDKVERKVLFEFPCSIEKEGKINVKKGPGILLKGFDTDKDGYVNNYCELETSTLDTNGDKVDDMIVVHGTYSFENCSVTQEIERNSDDDVIRNQLIYKRVSSKSEDLGASCQQAGLMLKNEIDQHLDKAKKYSDSEEAYILNSLGKKDEVIIDV